MKFDKQSDAEFYLLQKWQRLPLDQRQTDSDAAAFAMEYANKLDFPCSGDKFEALRGALHRYLTLTRRTTS